MAKVGRPKKHAEPHEQLVVRFTTATRKRLDAFAMAERKRTGLNVSRADCVRAAIDAGLAVLFPPEKK